jgi:hypothetical protein
LGCRTQFVQFVLHNPEPDQSHSSVFSQFHVWYGVVHMSRQSRFPSYGH